MANYDLFAPQISKVSKTTENLVITIYGLGGLGKTPVATKMDKPVYLAFGKSGLSGLNNVPFFPVNSWSDFKQLNRMICDKKNADKIKEMYHTVILDEMEILWKYLTEYVCQINQVSKIKEANSGYGAWGDLKDEWETEMLRLMGSGLCVFFILHAIPDDDGSMFPVGDTKRMLPIIINHSEIIGYVKGNGTDSETGRPIHSSLMLAGNEEYFARTRNEYFDPVIEDFTAENLVKAYYTALDRQTEAEGITPITKAEQDKLYETEEVDFDELMTQVSEAGEALAEKAGVDALTEIVESVLGKGKRVSLCTKKQIQAIKVILNDIKTALAELPEQ